MNTLSKQATSIRIGNPTDGLGRLRRRLLDLTSRNRLLNFRFPKRSCLRVVDEFPQQLFDALLDNRTLTFRPVQEPTEQKLEDYWKIESNSNVNTPPQKPTAETWARHLGIDTNYDLPVARPEEIAAAKHHDDFIQTLHYPTQLEALLRTLRSNAQIAIEESGSNMLYLVFGFIEWYQNEDSDKPQYAPLILVPAALKRESADRKTGTYQYQIAYSGEDIITNLSLEKKLDHDFGLALPTIGDDEGPETYFDRVASMTEAKWRWRVSRQITLSLFQFGKLLLYLDLDPGRWPDAQKLDDHPIVKRFFMGDAVEADAFATEHAVDELPNLATHIPLVDNADSSQLSALVDTMAGCDLVIEGPPGTGKSQTITNLIAAALNQGKSVLFISEKLAALEVVRRRLERASLGDFCLELHSHRTQKRALLGDLERRLANLGSYRSPKKIEQQLAEYEHLKERLKSHAALMAQSFGPFKDSVHDILNRATRLRRELAPAIAWLADLTIEGLDDVTHLSFHKARNNLRVYAEAHERVVSQYGKITDQPWAGVRNRDLQPFDAQRLVGTLKGWRDRASDLSGKLHGLLKDPGLNFPVCLETARNLIVQEAAVPVPQEEAWFDLLGTFAMSDDIDCASELLRSLKDYHDAREFLAKRLEGPSPVDRPQVDAIQKLAAALSEMVAPDVELLMLDQISAEIRSLTMQIRKLAPTVADIATSLLADPVLSVSSARMALHVISASAAVPLIHLDFRDPLLNEDALDDLLKILAIEVEELAYLEAKLAGSLKIVDLPNAEELSRAVRLLRGAGIFRWLSKDWRWTRQLARDLLREGFKLNDVSVPDLLLGAAEFRRRCDEIAEHKNAKRLLKHLYAGRDTQIEALHQLRNWYRKIHQQFGTEFGPNAAIGETLLGMPANKLKALAGLSDSGFAEALETFLSDLQTVRLKLPPQAWLNDDRSDLVDALPILHDLETRLAAAFNELRDRHIVEQGSVADLGRMAATGSRMVNLREVIEQANVARRLLGAHFAGTDTNVVGLAATISVTQAVAGAALAEPLQKTLFDASGVDDFEALRRRLQDLHLGVEEYVAARNVFVDQTQLDMARWLPGEEALLSLETLVERAERAIMEPMALSGWLDYWRSRTSPGLPVTQALIDLAETGKITTKDINAALDYVIYDHLAKSLLKQHNSLRDFRGYDHDMMRTRFAEVCDEIMKLQQQQIAATLDRTDIPAGVDLGSAVSRTDLCLIKAEISKQRRHLPIRQLVRRAGSALKALKPCFMMGPQSVAQYLEPGVLTFDIIVMDEASQMKPEDAIGAIARGKQLVVVGDPKQLPPTSFFDQIAWSEDEDPDELMGIEESESILDAAIPLFKPVRRLRWHYRSRHESLIAFSNHYFYNGDLIVIPSPQQPDAASLGITLFRVEDGVFRNHVNHPEAQRIAHAAVSHMEKQRSESLGVVAINRDQAMLIEEKVDRLLKDNPVTQVFTDAHRERGEPFFIKNLENVQGDERDVIMISFTYGPAEIGAPVLQRFGPINTELGWRRLNVLYTRAKNRIIAFSSMGTEDIRVSPTSHRGVQALKDYLAYAETGVLEQPRYSGRLPDSDFEVSVAEALHSSGYDTIAQVGVAGFFIDIGVRNPEVPESYLLGIECDGATYHSLRSVRDRDHIRQMVLERLGWKIHRVWSTDWFKDPGAELNRLLNKLEDLRHEQAGLAEHRWETD